jgi:hypothetical protein
MAKPGSTLSTQQGNANLDGGQFLTELFTKDARQAQFFQKVIHFVNNLAQNIASTGNGQIAPPPPIAAMHLKAAGEIVHVSHDHPGVIQRGVQYFTEVGVNDSGFNQPVVIDHGASRTSHPFHLPTNDDNGNPVKYYFRSYAQYHGSQRSGYAYWGTPQSPTAVTMTGSTNLTLLPSKGSGTAANNGTQGGQGLGNLLFRPAPGPKRTI